MINPKYLFHFFIFCSLLLLSSCDDINPALLKDLDQELLQDIDIMKEIDINVALKKLTKDMTFGDALVAGFYYQHKKDYEMMLKCYERALTVGGKPSLMKRLTLELAEAYITQKDYEKSKKHANTFVTLYPGDKEAKKAAFIEIQASYLSTNSSDRDQRKTVETIELINTFKKNYPVQSDSNHPSEPTTSDDYHIKIEEILDKCYHKILESELNITKTYVKKYNHFKNFSSLNAAQKRIKYIKNEILPHIAHHCEELNNIESYVDEQMRFELSKLIVQPSAEKSDTPTEDQ